ncbi:hypothetical protein M0208_17785 [Sphingomonas sp. SUN019]|uniref:hypothetical protein n=1 Tax=Sphingomonas sp. SUN019 TaxID=2937788 RepID=UPI002164D345|nr:hypothetical protein [Sphingomonas sp. SUN019]UVO52272.1 hypothetical protein M0208_17785 [Sphingomonas sp. SUN019]
MKLLETLAAVLTVITSASPASADWLQATSRHFVLYADTSEASLRKQAVALERMDQGLRRFMKTDDPPEAASNRLTVFVVSERDIRSLCRCDNVAGFYQARVNGPVAFSAKSVGMGEGTSDSGRIVLFHEYAHHFLLGSYGIAFPAWYSEGFAEFASTMKISPGKVLIGSAAQHRAWGLLAGQRLSAAQMFDTAQWGKLKRDGFDAFYGRGWLMTHYFHFNPERRKQFVRYLTLLNTGTPGVVAATEAFGDLKALDRDLAGYLGRSTIPGMTMMMGDTPEPVVTVRTLGAGEAALIRLRMESVRGVDAKTAAPLFAKAAPIAARYPEDSVAQGWFAEMAYDAGDNAVAEKAADRAVASDAKSVQGLLYKARVRLRALSQDQKADAAAWTAARKPIIAANRLDPDDAEPLWLFWESFGMEGREPIKSAMTGLYRAQELVPQDPSVRFAAAASRIMARENDAAKRLLRPLAYDPHAGNDNPATRMLAALDAGKTGAAVMAAAGDKPSAAAE